MWIRRNCLTWQPLHRVQQHHGLGEVFQGACDEAGSIACLSLTREMRDERCMWRTFLYPTRAWLQNLPADRCEEMLPVTSRGRRPRRRRVSPRSWQLVKTTAIYDYLPHEILNRSNRSRITERNKLTHNLFNKGTIFNRELRGSDGDDKIQDTRGLVGDTDWPSRELRHWGPCSDSSGVNICK